MNNNSKKCSFCAEEIQLDAKKCKHCGEWINSQGKKQTKLKYYSLSGKFNISGIIYPVLHGIIACIILGTIYGFIIRIPAIAGHTLVIPLLIIKIMIILIYGAIIGIVVSEGCKKGKIRNVGVASLLGFFLGIFAIFCSWVSWKYFLGNKIPDKDNLFWFIEAIIILICAIIGSRNISSSIFCESCQNWVKENGKKFEVEEINNLNEFKIQLKENIYQAFKKLERKKEDDIKNYSELEFKKCESCNNLNSVTVKCIKVKIEQVKKESDNFKLTSKNKSSENIKQPKVKKEEKIVIDRLLLDKETYELIIRDYENNN